MTTFEPIETADASAAVTTLLSKMFEFDPTLTLPENAIRTTTDAAHFLGGWDEIPETTALYQTELFSPMETSPMTEALECVSNSILQANMGRGNLGATKVLGVRTGVLPASGITERWRFTEGEIIRRAETREVACNAHKFHESQRRLALPRPCFQEQRPSKREKLDS